MIPEKDIRSIFGSLFYDFAEINWQVLNDETSKKVLQTGLDFSETQIKDLRGVVCEIIEKYQETKDFSCCNNCERNFPTIHLNLKDGFCHDCKGL